MPRNNKRTYPIENATILKRSFSGKPDRFHMEGSRYFLLGLSHTDELNLMNEGWNVKHFRGEDGMDGDAYIEVAVRFDNLPPKVTLISGKVETHLDEDTISQLDSADIENVDLVLSPFYWEVNGKSGVKAYLKTMYVTVARDEFADKYDALLHGVSPEDCPFDI